MVIRKNMSNHFAAVECDINKDKTWKDQYYCGLHCVWFRDDGEPQLCPVGEAQSVCVNEYSRLESMYKIQYQELERLNEWKRIILEIPEDTAIQERFRLNESMQPIIEAWKTENKRLKEENERLKEENEKHLKREKAMYEKLKKRFEVK